MKKKLEAFQRGSTFDLAGINWKVLHVDPPAYPNAPANCFCEATEDGNEEAMTPEQREMALYEAAVEKFGEIAQIDQATEEMAELIVALNKYKRYVNFRQGNKEEILAHIAEERADVEIMLNQLHVIFGDNTEKELEKLEHLSELVGMEGSL